MYFETGDNNFTQYGFVTFERTDINQIILLHSFIIAFQQEAAHQWQNLGFNYFLTDNRI